MKNILRATHLIYIEYLAFGLFVTLVNYWTIYPNGYLTIDVPMCLKMPQMSFYFNYNINVRFAIPVAHERSLSTCKEVSAATFTPFKITVPPRAASAQTIAEPIVC